MRILHLTKATLLVSYMPKRHLPGITAATRAAKKSKHTRVKMGAAVVINGKILGSGFNQIKTHPKATNAYKLIHAEHAAIIACKGVPAGAMLYVVRLKGPKGFVFGLARPCKHCRDYMEHLGIQTVVFSVNEKKFEIQAI